VTTFFLVRHAAHEFQDQRLVGRMPGIGLAEAGLRQVEALRGHFRTVPLDRVGSSPLPRARATAEALGRPVEVEDTLNEVDYGSWTGMRPVDLADDPNWRMWNRQRCSARIPGGESMVEVRDRVVGLVERLGRSLPDGRIALVSHRDVLRAVLLFHLGMPIGEFALLTVDPGSVSQLRVEPWGATLVRLNQTTF
jgi:broad specificity phosphatase PhoE